MDQDTMNRGDDREARTRECAYHLWETEGKPYGRDVEFWQRAREIIAHEDGNSAPMSSTSPTSAAAGSGRLKAAKPAEAAGNEPDSVRKRAATAAARKPKR